MFSDKLKDHVLFTEVSSVREICRPLKELGVDDFIYMRRFPDGSFVDLSTQLVWSKYFLDKFMDGKYQSDAIQDHMQIAPGISLWSLNDKNIIWQEGCEYFNYKNGVSICIDRREYSDIFCFCSKKPTHKMDEFYIYHMDLLKKFSMYFIEKARLIIEKGYSNRLITPDKYLVNSNANQDSINNFSAQIIDVAKTVFRKYSNHRLIILSEYLINSYRKNDPYAEQIEKFINQIESDFSFRNKLATLTKREMECLYLCIRGKTAKEASKELYLSYRTIESHLDNIKRKLDCANIIDLTTKYLKFYYGFFQNKLMMTS